MSDAELLQRYVREGEDSAFAALADRYLDLVYSVACRHVSPSLAEDVAQSVFIELARHAHDIKPGTPLIAWLHVVSRRSALNAARAAARRTSREHQAAANAAMKPESSEWRAVEPLLDAAVASLAATDRTAILLRFFHNKSLREVGAALGASDDAAQKRISRALDQLRAFFLRRGIPVTAAGLVADLGASALVPAPPALLAAITAPSFIFTATTTAVVAMTTLQKSAALLALALVAGFGAYRASVAHRQRAALAHLQAQPAAAHADPTASVTTSLSSTRASALVAGAADVANHRIAVLKQLLADLPAQGLPEIRLLTPDDWLAVARQHKLESPADIRVALAELRAMARRIFATALQEALRRYLATSAGQWPDNTSQLGPFLTAPADAEMLARYEITLTAEGSGASRKLIRENATSDLILKIEPDGWDITNNPRHPAALGENNSDAVDRALRAMSVATADAVDDQSESFGRLTAFTASIGQALKALGPDYSVEMKRAATAFVVAHPGETLTDVAQLLPILADPDKLIAAFRPVLARLAYASEHDGEMPTSADQLRTYLARPFSPSEAFRAMKLTRDGDDLDLDFVVPSDPPATGGR